MLLYDSPVSGNCYKVRLLLAHLAIPYERRTLDVVDRSSALSGAIHWTLREFEIYPGWTGGAGRRPGAVKNTRHHKGLLDYFGNKKPAWHVAREHFRRVPRHLRRP